MFETITKLRPYFFSLREIDNNVSLDIKIPTTWKYEEIVKPYNLIKIKIQDKNDKFYLLSLISSATQSGYDVVTNCANELILHNKEEEEKQRLLLQKTKELQEAYQKKLKELQEAFKKESLEKLKESNLINYYGQEITTEYGMVEQGSDEGQIRSGDTQITND